MKESQKGVHFAHKFEMLLDAFQQIIVNQSDIQKRSFYIDMAKKQLLDLYEELVVLEKELPQEIPLVTNTVVVDKDEIIQSHQVFSSAEMPGVAENASIEQQVSQSVSVEDVTVPPVSHETTSHVSHGIQHSPEEHVAQKHTGGSAAERTSTIKEQRVLAETLGQGRTSLIDQYSDKSADSSLVNKLHRTPIYDLKKSIGLNDRFTFINDLFQGNAVEFDRFINELQNVTDSQQIFLMFNSKAEALQWEGRESFPHFQEIISRYALSKQ